MNWTRINYCCIHRSFLVYLFSSVFFISFLFAVNNSTASAVDLPTNTPPPPSLQNVLQVAAGATHTCALTSNDGVSGGVKCWGDNSYAQLGDNTAIDRPAPVDVALLSSGVKAISAGWDFTCALMSSGGVKCWGYNGSGALGDGTLELHWTPVDVMELSNVSAINTGWYSTCALMTSGGVKCWGYNRSGQLGDGTTTDRSLPVDVVGLTSDVSAVSVGRDHACALLSNGGVKCWGNNDKGQLGDNSTTNRLTPVDVVGLSNVSAISAGANHTCALLNSGAIQCWGYNGYGQLGEGSRNDHPLPTSVINLRGGVHTISAGGNHTCALLNDGGVQCWGDNEFGQIGNDALIDQLLPVDVKGLSAVSQINAGGNHTCARLNNQNVQCWGSNGWGQVGDGTGADRPTPTEVVGLPDLVSKVSAGLWHTCALLKNGGVQCWGYNAYGQLGDGSSINEIKPVPVQGLSSGVSQISAGSQHTCALLTGGGIKCWGYNVYGQLGDPKLRLSLTPTDVISLTTGVSKISAGWGHTCALLTTGGVQCWGINGNGELGNGTHTSSWAPTDVVGLTSGVSAISAGWTSTCALLNSGGVKCWGANESGELGNGTTISSSVPVDVIGLNTGVTAISVGGGQACTLLAIGTVKCWGYNHTGQVGNGLTTNQLTPVDVQGLKGTVSAISAGAVNTCALLSSGAVQCWGADGYVAPGNDSLRKRLVAFDVEGLTSGASAIDASKARGHTCAVLTNGGVKCWGDNEYGQRGDGTGWRTTPVAAVRGGYFLVLDESGNPIPNAEAWLYHTNNKQPEKVLGDGAGYVLLPASQSGDKIIALQPMVEQPAPATDLAHKDKDGNAWKYRIYRTSMDIDAKGNAQPYVVGPTNIRVLIVKQHNPLILFNVVVSIGWKSYQGQPNYLSMLDSLHTTFTDASNTLFNATNGQFAFGQVSIYDGGHFWNEADVQITPSNHVRPFAIPGGITLNDPYTYTSSTGKQTTFYPGYIRLGRSWDHFGDPMAGLDNSDASQTLAHEFAHWAFGVLDEYFHIDSAGILQPASCNWRAADASHDDYSLMDRAYMARAFDMQDSNAFSDACRQTEQFDVHGESAWETIMRAYTDTVSLPQWAFTPTGADGFPKNGTYDLELALGIPQINSYVPEPSPNLVNTRGEVEAKLRIGQTQNGQSQSTQASVYYTEQAQVFLLKQKNGQTTILDEGTTNKWGKIGLVGVEYGDTIFTVSWDGTAIAAQTYDQEGPITIFLNKAPWSPVITARPVLENNRATKLAVMVTQVSALNLPPLFVTVLPLGAAALPDAPLTPTVEGSYVVTIPLSAEVTEGYLWVHAANDPIQPYQMVTTYSSGGSPDSHTRSDPPKDPSSSDGYCEFHVPNAALGENAPAIVVPTRNTPPLPVDNTRLQIVSAPCYIGVPAGKETFKQKVPLLMYYNQRAVEALGPDDTPQIYFWDEISKAWIAKGGQDDPRNRFVSGTIDRAGLYVLAGALPVATQLSTQDSVGNAVLNVLNDPFTYTVPISQVVATCNSQVENLFSGGAPGQAAHYERWFSGKPNFVNNLLELKPGQSYQIKVKDNCTLDLSQGVHSTAVGAELGTPAVAITVPLTSTPSTFYGAIQLNGNNAPPGMQIYARIDDHTIAQGTTFLTNGVTVYVLDLPADDWETQSMEGGRPSQIITFQVGNETVTQTGIWQAAAATQVDLTITTSIIYLPVIHR